MHTPDDRPPLLDIVPPRCPHIHPVETVEEMLPYLDAVAERPYSWGLHAAWGLEKGEHVLLYVDNWYDQRCVDAAVKTIEKYGCEVTVRHEDRGPKPTLEGHDEVEIFLEAGKMINGWMDEWRAMEEEGKYDKLLWGFGGPILADSKLKIARMPFITPEIVTSPAHTMPFEVLAAIDQWTWDTVCKARRVRITDPEGTDITYTNRDEYYDEAREQFRDDWLDKWVPSNKSMWRTYQNGHIWGRPWFLTEFDDCTGVIAGTTNHIGPYPRVSMQVENARVVSIEGGGLFGDKLRNLEKDTRDLQYPAFPGKGLLWLWEASIGTNPKVHRPRNGYLSGWVCGMYERMRSGVIHLGFGSVISTDVELEAVAAGLPVGHWHIHLYFPTVSMEMVDGSEALLIDNGHLKALDDPKIREIAAKYGDPDALLNEDWVPAVPGINLEGDYMRDYAADPLDWTRTELHLCDKWHHLFNKMVAPK